MINLKLFHFFVYLTLLSLLLNGCKPQIGTTLSSGAWKVTVVSATNEGPSIKAGRQNLDVKKPNTHFVLVEAELEDATGRIISNVFPDYGLVEVSDQDGNIYPYVAIGSDLGYIDAETKQGTMTWPAKESARISVNYLFIVPDGVTVTSVRFVWLDLPQIKLEVK